MQYYYYYYYYFFRLCESTTKYHSTSFKFSQSSPMCPLCKKRINSRFFGPLFLDYNDVVISNVTNSDGANDNSHQRQFSGQELFHDPSHGHANPPTALRSGSRSNSTPALQPTPHHQGQYDRNVIISREQFPIQNSVLAVDVRQSQRKRNPVDHFNISKIKCPICQRTFTEPVPKNQYEGCFACSIDCYKRIF